MPKDQDRPTPPDPHRPARSPSRPDVERSDADAERLKREAVSALRRVGADRARLPERRETPRGLPRPPVDTLHDGAPPPSDVRPPRSQSPAEGQAAILLDELAKARGKIADLERDKRAAAEVKVASFPPKVQDSPATPVSGKTVDRDPLSDEAVGKLVKASLGALLRRLGLPAALLACLGGGGWLYKSATDKPPPPPQYVTIEQLEAKLAKLPVVSAKEHNRLIRAYRCVRRQQLELGRSLLPDNDKMGSALKPQPFVDDCKEAAEAVKMLDEPDAP